MTTTPVQHTVDTIDSDFGTLDFTKVHWLHEMWLGRDDGGVQDTTSCWNDLTATTMDSVSVKGDIVNVETDTCKAGEDFWLVSLDFELDRFFARKGIVSPVELY